MTNQNKAFYTAGRFMARNSGLCAFTGSGFSVELGGENGTHKFMDWIEESSLGLVNHWYLRIFDTWKSLSLLICKSVVLHSVLLSHFLKPTLLSMDTLFTVAVSCGVSKCFHRIIQKLVEFQALRKSINVRSFLLTPESSACIYEQQQARRLRLP